MLSDPNAPGRPYVLHATDETVTEFRGRTVRRPPPPRHVIAMRTPRCQVRGRTPTGKPGGIGLLTDRQERELYDLRATTAAGSSCTTRSVRSKARGPRWRAAWNARSKNELRPPALPGRFGARLRRGGFPRLPFATRRRGPVADSRRPPTRETAGPKKVFEGLEVSRWDAGHHLAGRKRAFRKLRPFRAPEAPMTAPAASSAWTLDIAAGQRADGRSPSRSRGAER